MFGMRRRWARGFHSLRLMSHASWNSDSSHVFALSMLVAVISGIRSTSFIGSLHAVELGLCCLTIPGTQHHLALATFAQTRQRDLVERVALRVLGRAFEAQHQLTHRTFVLRHGLFLRWRMVHQTPASATYRLRAAYLATRNARRPSATATRRPAGSALSSPNHRPCVTRTLFTLLPVTLA